MWALTLYRSTIGKKAIMAVTGLILVAFVIAHMLGNLQVFIGARKMNAYAAFLQSTGELLWIARIGLLIAVLLHILMAWQLTQIKRKARPIDYDAWAGIFVPMVMKIATLIAFVALAYHAWIGMRDIWMDYVRPAGMRMALQLATILWLAGCLVWAAQILWKV